MKFKAVREKRNFHAERLAIISKRIDSGVGLKLDSRWRGSIEFAREREREREGLSSRTVALPEPQKL